MGVRRVARESAESAETAEMVAERSAAPAAARTATGSGVPSSAARAHTRRSSGEHDSGRSRRSRATPATSHNADSSGDDVDRAVLMCGALGSGGEGDSGSEPVAKSGVRSGLSSRARLPAPASTDRTSACAQRGCAASISGGAAAVEAAAHPRGRDLLPPVRRVAEHLRFVSVWYRFLIAMSVRPGRARATRAHSPCGSAAISASSSAVHRPFLMSGLSW
mmetsp:Transcript_4103/g.12787  ORF Transcript_4103/g.12787 Transcript_4103/m.12787 type:complete len:220 (-) Transcript_4103:162-821(-)